MYQIDRTIHQPSDQQPTEPKRVANPHRTTLTTHMERTGHEPYVPVTGRLEVITPLNAMRPQVFRPTF